MTAERGVLSAPAVQNMSEGQIYDMTWPPSKHDDYLPEPTSLNAVHTEGTRGEVPIISLESITGSVVMLPQIVPALRNNSPRRPLTLQYRDPYSWDLPTLSGMLSAFFRASGTTSLPPLEEYTMLPDKTFLQEAYEAYYAEDPGQRVPPIPTVKLTVPGSAKEHSLLCYTDHKFTASESHIDAIMKAVYFGLVKLDSMIPLDSDIRAVQVCRAVSTPMYLRRAAEVLAKESCGEPWLLQPKIRDMESLEYRVYLLRGAKSSGQPNDTAVYYVAGDVVHEGNGGLRRGLGAKQYMNIAPGYFWSDSLFPPGWKVEDYLEDSSAAQVKVSNSTAAPPIDSAEGDGECVANSTLQAGEGVKDDDNSIIIVYEHEMPRVQWHHPDLYDTIVQREPSHWPKWVQKEQAARMEQLSTEQQVRGGWGYTLAKGVAEAVTRQFLKELYCANCDYVIQAE
ncbi:hypothetical protein WJX75_006097 [Coccomyxa subellipsoidea]|uniref:Uncharacterized protein n=1 Tax=Coccomyxa subellipsoidea TaxID=248742 RepID=A0ABR2YPR3_9CHLO